MNAVTGVCAGLLGLLLGLYGPYSGFLHTFHTASLPPSLPAHKPSEKKSESSKKACRRPGSPDHSLCSGELFGSFPMQANIFMLFVKCSIYAMCRPTTSRFNILSAYTILLYPFGYKCNSGSSVILGPGGVDAGCGADGWDGQAS